MLTEIPARPEIRLILNSVQYGATERSDTIDLGACDPTYLTRTAWRNGVVPLVCKFLTDTNSECVQYDVYGELKEQYGRISRRNRGLAAELDNVVQLLEAKGIRPVPFKGPTLAVLAHDCITLRQFWDLDILVCDRDVSAAKNFLEAENYRTSYWGSVGTGEELSTHQLKAHLRNYHEWELRGENGINIDLHWHSAPRRYPFRLRPEWLLSDLQSVSIENRIFHTFAIEQLILFLCVHGAKDGWKKLVTIVDLDRLIRRSEDIDWQIIFHQARVAHAERVLSFGLWLTTNLLGTPLPSEVAVRLGSTHSFESLSKIVLRSLFPARFVDRERDIARSVPLKRVGLGLCKGISDKSIYIYRSVTTPRPWVWSRVRLPDRLFPLYNFITPLLFLSRFVKTLLRSGQDRSGHFVKKCVSSFSKTAG